MSIVNINGTDHVLVDNPLFVSNFSNFPYTGGNLNRWSGINVVSVPFVSLPPSPESGIVYPLFR